MAVVKVIEKNSEIDGRPITWNVLSITGFMQGDIQTLELKLSKTEAMLANLLLKSDENKPEVHTKAGGNVEVTKTKDESLETDDWLND